MNISISWPKLPRSPPSPTAWRKRFAPIKRRLSGRWFLFSQSDSQQRAGILNRLLGAADPGILWQIPGLAGLLHGGQQVTAQQAQQVPPESVQQLATHAEQKNPSIVDEVSNFYAQHPDVVKALGGMALAIAIQKMVRR